jgi:hypothetical protein
VVVVVWDWRQEGTQDIFSLSSVVPGRFIFKRFGFLLTNFTRLEPFLEKKRRGGHEETVSYHGGSTSNMALDKTFIWRAWILRSRYASFIDDFLSPQ